MSEHLREEQLNALVDGALAATERDAVLRHVAECATCRADVERLEMLLAGAKGLPRSIEPPRDLWPMIAPRLGRRGVPLWVGIAAALVLAFGGLLLYAGRGKAGNGWMLAERQGRPTIDGGSAMRSVLRVGQKLETDEQSAVRLSVTSLGTVSVRPSTTVRLLASSPQEQRLALDHGTIEARIIAPARVFLVETPAALAVDLGCAYILSTDSTGNGSLRVTSGWVELTNGTRVTIVPRDAEATIRARHGPGTAHAPDAPPELRAALAAWDFEDGGEVALRNVLRAARRRIDAVTLLNLLVAAPATLRGDVYAQLARIAPPPRGVTREGALGLDRTMLNRWWDDVVPPRLEKDPNDPKARVRPSATLQGQNRELAVERVASGLDMPLHLTAPAGDRRLFIVEQDGRIRIVTNGALLARPFLDISSKIRSGGEQGLLSLAFHPRYAQNGLFYVNYTDRNGDTQVERYKVSSDADVADPASAHQILFVKQPYANHNGGHILFGPDGMLYVGMGDGGSGGDPHRNGQDRGALLGKLLRIDVDQGDPYANPPDNPFVQERGSRPEIWAYGLRNPWRMAFDWETRLLYIADVGQNRWEEVNVQPAAAAGVNYGWNRMEGAHCYGLPVCTRGGLVEPVIEYNHDDGCSITGGVVYRGKRLPFVAGHYFYSDYCTGFLRSFTYENGVVTGRHTWKVDGLGSVLSFGEDGAGEVYILSSNGSVYRLIAKP